MDIAYLSEIDPTWVDSSLTTILNPEAILFANPIAQGACAADALASAFHMPLDVLFWCGGSHGSLYPFNGQVSNESSPLQSSVLVSERMAFKLHRQGQGSLLRISLPDHPERTLALSDGEHVSGQWSVPSAWTQRDALGGRQKSAQHPQELWLPDVA
ncbi:putative TraU protein [Klebsiella pneumoniae]|nr:putative TraU protein [Klebsiella pneumoniae]